MLSTRLARLVFFLMLIAVIFVVVKKTPELNQQDYYVFENLGKDSIEKIIVTVDDDKSEIVKKNKKFEVMGQKNKPDFRADSTRIDNLIEALSDLETLRVISENENKYETFEVDGKRKIEVVLKDKKQKTIFVGKNHTVAESYFRIKGDSRVYISGVGLMELITPVDFRMLTLDIIDKEEKVSAVKLINKGSSLQLTKDDKGWKVQVTGKTSEADSSEIELFLSSIANLKAEDVIKKGDDLTEESAEIVLEIEEGKSKKKAEFFMSEEMYHVVVDSSEYLFIIPAQAIEALQKTNDDFIVSR